MMTNKNKRKGSQYTWQFFLITCLLLVQMTYTEKAAALGPDVVVTNLNEGLTAEELVAKIIGENSLDVRNVTFTGSELAVGTFNEGLETFGVDSGIVLSTGQAKDIIGPNRLNEPKSTELGKPGDADLSALVNGSTTYDATILEFDFLPQSDTISIQYVLTSEEYPDSLSFSDVFGFFVNGQNIAWLPGKEIPVTITNINHVSNSEYYLDNPEDNPIYNTSMNGMTVVLTAESSVNVGQWNHIKLAIADYKDSILDSNILIKSGSMTDERPVLEALTLNSSASKLRIGETEQLVVTGKYSNGMTKDVTSEAIYQSSNEEIVTVSETGILTGVASGTAVISATYRGQTVEVSVQVRSNQGQGKVNPWRPLGKISLNRDFYKIREGEATRITVGAYYLDNHTENVTSKATYTSSKEAIVTVNEEGEITAHQEGIAVITVRYNGKIAEAEIEVLPASVPEGGSGILLPVK
ncbi:choice-of-anchor L domain-containing protein [Halalkalibacter nanhaiisediminis]|uniref:choice-of-anchor L domain-containing protein n=1 Tax=Halalkalibacter nanhaiisediminis TaxID=688079 RepID=UPI001F550BDE|nr:choice-of-anchor L domain-containing protein [Halalkalibacter nanhaiisediminis]